MGRLVDSGLLRVHVGGRFALEDLAEAHRRIETRRTIGKMAVAVAAPHERQALADSVTSACSGPW